MNQTRLQEPEMVKSVGALPENASPNHTDHEDDHDHGHALNWREINRVLFVAAAAGAIWFLGGTPNPYITAIGVICTLVGGFPIFHEAYENITQRRMTMELSMTIAIVAALAIREIFTALIITLFVLVAEILEGLTVGRGRQAIQRLIDLLPSTATVRRRGNGRTFPLVKSPSAMKFLLVQEHASRSTARLSVGIPLLTKRRSRANPCQLRRRWCRCLRWHDQSVRSA